MAHIMGFTYVDNVQVFAIDESGNNFSASAGINGSTAPVSVGQLIDPDFRVYVATSDGKIALFPGGRLTNPPQFFQATGQSVLWSLYHAAGVLYLGTADFSSPGPFLLMALDDLTFATRWQVLSPGPVSYPAGVGYVGNVAKQVIFSSGNPAASLRALDVASGAELWNAPDYAFGQKVHDGVVYYANLVDNSLRARSASNGALLWSFMNPSNFNFNRPVAAGGVVWASTVGNQLFAIRAADGTVLWQVQLDGHPGVPVIHFEHGYNNIALVAVAEQNGGLAGFLRAFDANTGAPLWTSSAPVSQPGGSCTDPIVIPHFENGFQVQVGTFDGTLMTFSAYDGQLLWQQQISPGLELIAKPHWVSW